MEKRKRSARRAVIGIVLFFLFAAAAAAAFLAYRYPVRHVDIINKYSQEYGLDPVLVFSLINAESGFNDNAVSNAGASGLMQLMEDTAVWIAPMAGLPGFSYEQIFIPEVNIHLGCFYLSMYLQRFGTVENALCAYNAGGGTVERWLADPQLSRDGITLDKIPYEETRNYVSRIDSNLKVYKLILPLY